MINSYGEQPNPCTFCIKDENVQKHEEYLEFSLCGNDTTLFVREVSVEEFIKPEEGESSSGGGVETSKPTSAKPTSAVAADASVRNLKIDNKNRSIDALYTKKWSGHTYFEEELRRIRDEEYERELKQAMKRKKMWQKFQKDILKDRRKDLVKSSGPDWWQEPSTKQIVLATTLKDVIKTDYEEEVTGRTRQWLLDLGVTTRLKPVQVRRCMKRSLLEPVDFLLEAHVLVVKSQLNTKKTKQLERPFSVDERLLLTAVCVLQLPTLLTMLHYLLPPPKPFPMDKYKQEVLFGDLDDETIRYLTPYMEPLPFRNKVDFENWAFGKICTALLPVLLKNKRAGQSIRKPELSEKITSDLKRSLSIGSQLHSKNSRLSVRSTAPSVALLLSYCLSKRRGTDSMKVCLDELSLKRKNFGRRLTFLGKFKNPIKQSEPFKGDRSEDPVLLLDKSLEALPSHHVAKNTTPAPAKEENHTTPSQEYGPSEEYGPPWTNQPWQADLSQPIPPADYAYAYPIPQYYDNMHDQQVDYSAHTTDNPAVEKPSKEDRLKLQRTNTNETAYSKTSSKFTVEQTRPDTVASLKNVHNEQEEDCASLRELETIWEEIGTCMEKEQLQKAITVLTEMGDPLAQLPKIVKLPTIQRWLELRRGRNRILAKSNKEELLNRSRGMWKSVNFSSLNKGPKVKISKREERKLTWDKKKWLESETKKEKENYFTRLRQEKVDNARSFFPTMLNHYDYGSKLNRNFRDVFFTYLPAREADTFVYQPSRTSRNKKF